MYITITLETATTTQEVFQKYENHLASLAHDDLAYDECILFSLAAFFTELDAAEDRGATCSAELAEKISKHGHIQYYMNLMALHASVGNKYVTQ